MFIPDINTDNYLRIKDPYLKFIFLFFIVFLLLFLSYYLCFSIELNIFLAILIGFILLSMIFQIFLLRKCSKCNAKMSRAYDKEERVINICENCKTFIDLYIGLSN